VQANKYDIRLMSRAEADLARIEEYYIQEGGRELAEKILERIFEEILIFEDCPRAGRPYKRLKQRLFPIYAGRYVVAYIIDEAKLQVKIVGIPRAESDWMRHLNRYFKTRNRKPISIEKNKPGRTIRRPLSYEKGKRSLFLSF
jgi:plasmid stabilization system protein ParE